jgi:hypothetical protein
MENRINVAPYICELLFRHDCVVVPGFGGFVCTYAPARIHPAQHTFQSPSKQIVFNKHLQQNDGLLAHTISAAVPCSFEEAMQGITDFVNDCSKRLKANEKINFTNLGTLWLDVERNTCFESEPDVNFLIDAFGLSSFRSLPIIRETIQEKHQLETRREDRPAQEERPVAPMPQVNLQRRRLKIAAAIGIPLLIAALILPFSKAGNNALAGLGIIAKKEASTYIPYNWTVPKFDVQKENILSAPDSLGHATLKLTDDGAPIPVSIHAPVAESTSVTASDIKPVPKHFQQGAYFVIGGCFEVADNAAKFQIALKGKGYNPEILEQVKSRLTHVSISSFLTKAEAEKFLQQVKADVPEAWILHK